MIGETLCSGIGAPEVAAPWIDWRRAFDIDDFARAVFVQRHGYAEHAAARRYVGGDFTGIGLDDYRRHGWPWPDVIVAGTPCQAFSVAGLRRGLRDKRGNVTLEFVRHAHAITDAARSDGHPGPVIVWENVPGVFSQSDNAFGAFLGGLVGSDDALPRPFGESWPDAGMASGPRGRLAWRVLDAQHFGLAQRRRRVFLVFDPGGRADPAAVLFERQGVRGHSSAGGEAREDVAGGSAAGAASGGGGLVIACKRADTLSVGANQTTGFVGDVVAHAIGHHGDISGTLSAKMAKGTGAPAGDETQNVVAYAMRADAMREGVAKTPSPDCNGRMSLRHPGMGLYKELAPTLDCGQAHSVAYCQRVADPLVTREAATYTHEGANFRTRNVMAFSANDHGADAGEIAPTLRAMGHANTSASGCGNVAVAFAENSRVEVRLEGGDGARTGALSAGGGKAGQGVPCVSDAWIVRRLTPRECERLQGFPDDFTRIPWRGAEAPDSRRYKALGNSMAVPVIAWILRRVTDEMESDYG